MVWVGPPLSLSSGLPLPWSLDKKASSIGISNKVFGEILMEEARNRRFVAVGTQPSNNVEKGRPLRVLPPPWMRRVVLCAAWPEGLQGRQQQQTVRSNRQSWVTGHRLLVAYLGFTDSQNVFFITMIDFDLPSIKTGLDQQLDRGIEIGGQKISWLAVVGARVFGKLVGHRGDYYQSQSPLPGSALPQHAFHLFVSYGAPFASHIDTHPAPRTVLLAHLFWGEDLLIVFAAGAFRSRKAQSRILAAASHQMGPFQMGIEHRLVRETPIPNSEQRALTSASFVQARAKASNHIQGLSREIICLLQLVILLAIFLAGTLARFLQRRSFLKPDRNTSRRIIAFLIVGEQHRRLHKPQAVQEVHMKRRRQRIALPSSAFDFPACLSNLGIVNSAHHRHLGIPVQILVDDRIEQSLRLPLAAREHLIIAAPVMVAPAQGADRAGNGPATKHARQGDGMFDSTLVAAALREGPLPSAVQEGVKLLNQHHYSPPFSPKTFLSVRTNWSPRFTFLTRVETIDSRSSLIPCTFSTRSMISVTWSGFPERRSTSCTI